VTLNPKVIKRTPPAKCDLCGETAELRPYGPNGENVCFPCGQKDPIALAKRAFKALFGDDITDQQAAVFTAFAGIPLPKKDQEKLQ
jgi:hypothetical protein